MDWGQATPRTHLMAVGLEPQRLLVGHRPLPVGALLPQPSGEPRTGRTLGGPSPQPGAGGAGWRLPNTGHLRTGARREQSPLGAESPGPRQVFLIAFQLVARPQGRKM